VGKPKFQILLIDDDVFFANYVANVLTDIGGYLVTQSHSVDDGLELARKRKFPLVIVDLKMPPGKAFDSVETSGGHKTGLALARQIKNVSVTTKILVHSAAPEIDFGHLPFEIGGATFLRKSSSPMELIRAVRQILQPHSIRPKSFIVHGHDHTTVLELKNYLQNRLGFDEPTILAEQPFLGLTTIERFEVCASGIDWVLVLLTPDDTGQLRGASSSEQARARQNVIFELGFFHGLMGRRSGRIVLLYKGTLEIPSDLSGIGYIDITNGIEAAGEHIRRNLSRRV
jgi:DNA-binding NarL/FixJ family response regulator